MNDDVDFESEEELGATGAAQAKLKKMREELAMIKAERQEYLDGWQRCKADGVNLKREAEARASRAADILREDLVHDIIPALDSFDMAAESEAWESVAANWRNGMEYVRNQLTDALKRHGIERFGAAGEPVDHTLHEVVEERDDVEGEPDTIARVLRHGYRTKDRILRPAHVVLKSARKD